MNSGTLTPRKKLPPPKRPGSPSRRVTLTEIAHGVGPLPVGKPRVDREAGVIYAVRVCGVSSDNSRVYPPDVLKKAIPLYEQVKVRMNHPKRPLDDRDVSDTLGWLENVRQGDDGALYADLHFLHSHPYAEALCEVAERNPSLVGLSHNADGQGREDERGRFVIQEIQAVRSVDLVDRPATSESIFESKETPMPQTTLRQLIEASKAKPLFKRLLEMPEDEMPPLDMPMDAPPEAPVEGDWKADLVAAIGKLVSSENEEDHKLAQKVMAMLKPQAVAPPEEIITEEDESEEKDDEEKEEEKMESRRKAKRAAGTVTLTEDKAKRLCKLASVPADAELLEALKGLTEEKAMSLLEWQQKRSATTPARSGVRSQSAGGTDTTTPKFPTTPDERRKLLTAV